MKTKLRHLILLCSCLMAAACKKGFLDQKPAKSLLVPSTATDFRAILDNNFVFNNTPALTSIADGDTYTTDAGWNGYTSQQERNSYTWSADIFGTEPTNDWNLPYQQVFYANIVLDGLQQLPAAPGTNELRGEALFHRAFAFYNLALEFAAPYRPATAGSLPGIPLRLDPDVSKRVTRSTLSDTYRQVIADLAAARVLLPVTTDYKSRPSLVALYALLSRVYLNMQDYPRAGAYADSALSLSARLIDYNTLNPAATRPFPRALPDGNDEVIFDAIAQPYTYATSASPTFTDSLLYRSYADNDLRRVLFFRAFIPGSYKFKGNYAGILSLFSGIATDEVYLGRAECNARSGNSEAAMSDLNTVLRQRWKTGTFIPYTAPSAGEALRIILAERRKELTGRGLRWADLRRLNDDPLFAVSLTRVVNGQTYSLQPGSKRYVYPIPAQEVNLNQLVQNER